jgi:hypothetical protein
MAKPRNKSQLLPTGRTPNSPHIAGQSWLSFDAERIIPFTAQSQGS